MEYYLGIGDRMSSIPHFVWLLASGALTKVIFAWLQDSAPPSKPATKIQPGRTIARPQGGVKAAGVKPSVQGRGAGQQIKVEGMKKDR